MRNFMLLFTIAHLVLNGCQTLHYQRAEVLERQNNISQLKQRIDFAIANDVDLLAPSQFEQAKSYFDRAIKEAQNSQNLDAGDKIAADGLDAIEKAEKIAKKSRYILSEVLEKRAKAYAVQAHLLFPDEFKQLENEIMQAGRAFEVGNQKEAIEANASVSVRFAELELKTLKKLISETAQAAYDEAIAAASKRLAPKTLKKAQNELQVAKKILDIEKSNYDKAQFHAERARYLAQRAKHIADLLTGFKKEKLTDEEIVLWYQEQLEQIHHPLPTDLPLDLANKEVINFFKNEITNLASNLKNVEQRALSAEEKINEISERFADDDLQKEDAVLEAATIEEHFREISKLFSKNEAEVVKRDNDIIIRSYGFNFSIGKADIQPRNFRLLHKIVFAISKFPSSKIEIEGHTDSSGSKDLNMRLSNDRAKNIADFLTKIVGIAHERVTSKGYGSEHPLASNDNAAGRAKNRRIEVIIRTKS
jgi:outer membrane protein OmpA-like peptidoglycan-associated protein